MFNPIKCSPDNGASILSPDAGARQTNKNYLQVDAEK